MGESNKAVFLSYASQDAEAAQVAEIYADFGDADQAFKWLGAAVERDLGIIWLHNDPLFKGLTRDPRYARILRKLKLAR